MSTVYIFFCAFAVLLGLVYQRAANFYWRNEVLELSARGSKMTADLKTER
jgi:hypothetical protein